MWPEILKKAIQEIIKDIVRPKSTVSEQQEKQMYDEWLRENSPPPVNKDTDQNGYELSKQYKDGQYENEGDEYNGLLRPTAQNEAHDYEIRQLSDTEIEFNDNSGNLISVKESMMNMCPVLSFDTKDISGNILGQDKIIDLGEGQYKIIAKSNIDGVSIDAEFTYDSQSGTYALKECNVNGNKLDAKAIAELNEKDLAPDDMMQGAKDISAHYKAEVLNTIAAHSDDPMVQNAAYEAMKAVVQPVSEISQPFTVNPALAPKGQAGFQINR